MKRIIAITALTIAAALALAGGCSGKDKEGNSLPYDIFIVEIEGHGYIKCLARFGGSIVHAESCPCKTAKPAPSQPLTTNR